jgi:hypothetical protein
MLPHYLNKDNASSLLSFGINDEKNHSEVNAILKLRFRREKLKNPIKISALVIRVSSTGELGMSRPCAHCTFSLFRLPRKFGYVITDIYYSNENGNIIKTNINELLEGPQHISRGNR